MDETTWTCGCGSVEARVPTTGKRIVCYCESCRGFVERLGKEDRLDHAGGSDLLQVTPQEVRFVKGAEHLKYLKMSEKGPLRWYASCCGTPMANTLGTRAVAFASFQVRDLAPNDHLPPVTVRVHLTGALARVVEPTGSLWPLMGALLGRTVKAWVTGGWRRNPFFTTDGKPIASREDPVTSTG